MMIPPDLPEMSIIDKDNNEQDFMSDSELEDEAELLEDEVELENEVELEDEAELLEDETELLEDETELLEDETELLEDEDEAELVDTQTSDILNDIFNEDEPDWNPDYDSLSLNIESLNKGLDLPSNIFSLAVNSFNIKSGLFLTYESVNRVFTPFASLSIDETSLRRCHIDSEVLEKNNIIFSGTEIHPGISKGFLKKYLSTRVWDTIENLDIIIFNHHDKIFGLLLMFNSDANTNSQFYDFASFFARKTSELFYNSRSRILSSLPSASSEPPVDITDFKKILNKKINSFHKEFTTGIKTILIDYTDIIKSLINKNDSIDPYRVEYDIFKMYNSMLFGSSFIIRFSNHKLLIVFLSGLTSNDSIIENQMSTSLMSLFDKGKIFKQPVIKVAEINTEFSNLADSIFDFVQTKT